MITEDYVSFELAKLLKEKEFDEGCRLHYHYVEAFNKYFPTDESISGFEQYYYPCPTIQMTMKWLREVHNIALNVCYLLGMWSYSVYRTDVSSSGFNSEDFDTYEEACEAAIKYCLENLI